MKRLATATATVSLALAVSALFVMAVLTNGTRDMPTGDVETMIAVILFALGFPVVGWVIVRRLPSNPLGWTYLAIGFWESVNLFATAYSAHAYQAGSVQPPLAPELSWVASWAWVPAFSLFSTVGILLFPTGRLPSRRWWPVVALAVIAILLSLVPVALASWPYRGLVLEQAQIADIPPPPGSTIATAFVIQEIGQLVLLAAMLASVVGLALRFRRARGVERQQLKWFVYAALLDLAIIVVWMFDILPLVAGVLTAVLVGLSLPAAIGIAIGRYRLYEIDLIIRRTLVYATLSGALAAIYVGLVLVLQVALSGLAPSNELAIAVSTLGVAGLFQPLRHAIQEAVDRRFYRARYDAARIVTVFSSRLRQQVDLTLLTEDLARATREALQPTEVTIWIRGGGP